MEEVWKDIKNYEGYYKVSNTGKVKSLLFQNNVHNKKYPREKILNYKGQTYKTGYRVDLWKNGIHKTMLVARLVAFTFYNKDINDHELTVNHIDGNRFNNNVSNLELVSIGDNVRHAFRTGLIKTCKSIIVADKKDHKETVLNSMSKAGLFINKDTKYISGQMKRNVYENERYKWSYYE